jgi:hypothetical protein
MVRVSGVSFFLHSSHSSELSQWADPSLQSLIGKVQDFPLTRPKFTRAAGHRSITQDTAAVMQAFHTRCWWDSAGVCFYSCHIYHLFLALISVHFTDNVRTPTRRFTRIQHIPFVPSLRLRLAMVTCTACGPCL